MLPFFNKNKLYKVRVKGQEHGPYTYEQMDGFIQQGRMNLQTQVFIVGEDWWKPAVEYSELASLIRKHDKNSNFQQPIPSNNSCAEEYKVLVNGQEHGPYMLEQMYNFIQQGRLNAQTQVMKSGHRSWRPAASFNEFSMLGNANGRQFSSAKAPKQQSSGISLGDVAKTAAVIGGGVLIGKIIKEHSNNKDGLIGGLFKRK